MANATTRDSATTNPGGTGTTITAALSTHAAGDIIKIAVGNTGNTLWTGNPAGWNRVQQVQVGTSANGLLLTIFQRRVLVGDTLPLANPTFTLGATVSRIAFAWSEDGASEEGVFSLSAWAARSINTGTANPVRPGAITTPAPEGLITTVYFSRAATNAPDPSGYTQDEEIVISGTLVGNLSHKVVADQATVLSNQDASPTSGVRWAAAIFCTPSADYPYYRSASQATASGTNVTPALPSGTTATDVNGNKDFMVITVEGAGSTTLSMTDGAWTLIATWQTTTSGGGSTVSKFWAYMTSTPPSRQANRTGSGEISAQVCTFYNTKQSSPIGNVNVRLNASSTTSTFDALTRLASKCIVQATCIADAVPTFTSPATWIEHTDGLGITTADQVFNDAGSCASASFTLSSGSPTAVGLVEIKGAASVSGTDVALTGISSSAALGSVAGERSVNTTGSNATGSLGSVAFAASAPVSGQSGTVAAGSIAPAVSLSLSGNASTATAGDMTSAADVALTGLEPTTISGDLTVVIGGDVTTGITSVSASVETGILGPGSAPTFSGEASTTSTGTLILASSFNLSGDDSALGTGDALSAFNATLGGLGSSAQPGTVILTLDAGLEGIAASVSPGTVSVGQDVSAALSGDQVTLVSGDVSPRALSVITGLGLSGTVSSLSVSVNVSLNGVQSQGRAGSLSLPVTGFYPHDPEVVKAVVRVITVKPAIRSLTVLKED